MLSLSLSISPILRIFRHTLEYSQHYPLVQVARGCVFVCLFVFPFSLLLRFCMYAYVCVINQLSKSEIEWNCNIKSNESVGGYTAYITVSCLLSFCLLTFWFANQIKFNQYHSCIQLTESASENSIMHRLRVTDRKSNIMNWTQWITEEEGTKREN